MGTVKLSRRQMLRLMAAGGIFSLSGCVPATPPTPAAAPTAAGAEPTQAPPAAAPVTIEVWGFQPIMTKKNGEMIKRYKDKAPNVTVNWTEVPDTLTQKLLAAIAANSGIPDAPCISSQDFSGLRKSGQLPFVDLSTQIDAHKKEFFPQRLLVWEDQGKLYGVDWVMNPIILYIRKDVLVDQLGVTIPFDTWADFVAAGKKAAQGQERFLTSALEWSQWPLLGTFLQLHNSWYMTADGKVTVDTPEALDSVTLLRDMVRTDKVMTDKLALFDPGWDAAIKEGRLLGEIGPDWTTSGMMTGAPEQEGKWGAIPLSRLIANGPRLGSGSGAAYLVTQASKYPDVAWDYIYFSNWTDEAALVEFEISGSFPVTYSGLALPDIQKDHKYFPKTNNWKGMTWGQVVAELGAEQPLPVMPPGVMDVVDLVNREVWQPVMSGTAEPAAALASAQTKAEALVK